MVLQKISNNRINRRHIYNVNIINIHDITYIISIPALVPYYSIVLYLLILVYVKEIAWRPRSIKPLKHQLSGY